MERPNIILSAGVGATMYSWLVAATEITQFIGAVLGVLATCLAIYLHLRKLRER